MHASLHGKDAALIRDLASGLDRTERLVVALRFTEELTVAEIASVTRLTAVEVQRTLDAAAARVRTALAGRPRLESLRSA